MADKAVFNIEQLLSSCAGDADLAAQVAGVFLTDIPKQLNDLDTALKDNDAATIERVCHSIKGASATVGGDALRLLALECEHMAHEGDSSQVADKVAELRSLYDQLRDELVAAGYSS